MVPCKSAEQDGHIVAFLGQKGSLPGTQMWIDGGPRRRALRLHSNPALGATSDIAGLRHAFVVISSSGLPISWRSLCPSSTSTRAIHSICD